MGEINIRNYLSNFEYLSIILNAKMYIELSSIIITSILGFPLTTYAQTTEQTITYTDPLGRYSIGYPSSWKVEPALNRFEDIEIEFVNPNLPPSQLEKIDIRVLKDAGPVGDLGNFMELGLSSVYIPQFRVEESIDCELYSLTGAEETCSVVYSRASDHTPDFRFAVLQVAGLLNDDIYILTYSSSLDQFDQNLPEVEEIVNSFSITEGEEVTNED